MKINIYNIIFFKTIILISLVSCTSTKKAQFYPPVASNGQVFPKWIEDPRYDGKIAAIGSAPKSRGGFSIQRDIALAKAKFNLAKSIKSTISTITKNATQVSTVNGNENLTTTFENAGQAIVKNLTLEGVRQVNIGNFNNELFIRVALSKENFYKQMNKQKENSLKKLKEKLVKSNIARSEIEKNLQATKNLFNKLENLEK